MFDKKAFNEFVLENNVIGFFKEPLKLKSGRMSHWYVNWRTVLEDVYLADRLSDFIIEFVKSEKIDVSTFFGVPEGATKLGLLTQYKWAKSKHDFAKGKYAFSMCRGKPKDYGDPKDRYFLGFPRGNTVVIEDVTTTGGSLLSTIEQLVDSEVSISAAIGLTNRMEKRNDGKTVEEVVSELGVEYYAMSDAVELLPLAYKKQKPNADVKKGVEEYFRMYGIKEVVLG